MCILRRIRPVLFLAVVLFPTGADAQFPSTPDRFAAAGSVLFQTNLGAAAFGNPAIGDSVIGLQFLLYSTQAFLVSELTETGAACSFRLPGPTQFTAAVATKGFESFQRQHAVLAVSRRFSAVSAGIRAAYSGTRFGEGYPGQHGWHVTAGTRIRFGRQIEMLADMRIPVDQSTDEVEEEARLGCIHHFSSRFSAGVEATQSKSGLRLSTALRYRPGDRMEFFGGLSGRDPVWSFGCGLVVKGVRILIAASHRSWLGFSPGLSVESPWSRPR